MPSSPALTTELLQGLCPDLQQEDVLQLHLGEDFPPDDELAVMYMLATLHRSQVHLGGQTIQEADHLCPSKG